MIKITYLKTFSGHTAALTMTQSEQDKLQALYEARDWDGYTAELKRITDKHIADTIIQFDSAFDADKRTIREAGAK